MRMISNGIENICQTLGRCTWYIGNSCYRKIQTVVFSLLYTVIAYIAEIMKPTTAKELDRIVKNLLIEPLLPKDPPKIACHCEFLELHASLKP